MGIHHKLTPAKHPRRRCNECCPELKSHVNQVESVSDGAKHSHRYCQLSRYGDACSTSTSRNRLKSIHNWKVIKEGIYKDSNKARDHKELVPLLAEFAAGIKDCDL
jgi:hypothetical protein